MLTLSKAVHGGGKANTLRCLCYLMSLKFTSSWIESVVFLSHAASIWLEPSLKIHWLNSSCSSSFHYGCFITKCLLIYVILEKHVKRRCASPLSEDPLNNSKQSWIYTVEHHGYITANISISQNCFCCYVWPSGVRVIFSVWSQFFSSLRRCPAESPQV